VWNCPNCKRLEKTSPSVRHLAHLHGKEEIELTPYKKPMKPRGEVTLKTAKKDAAEVFSEYIRRVSSDYDGYCQCVTCGKRDKWQNMQDGHYFSRSNSGTFFDIRNNHVQCVRCNVLLKGNYIEYNKFMLKEYGQKVIDQLEYLSKRRHSFTIFELNQYKQLYLKKVGEFSE
jgi:hypothetical protein